MTTPAPRSPIMPKNPKVTLLCGGVGGSKLAEGFYHSKYRAGLKIIGNVGDDQAFHGLWVSPDIDTLTYTLAGVIDKNQGWGRENDSASTLTALNQLGLDTWMFLGDKDFATHIFRSELRRKGVSASAIAQKIARQLGVKVPILLPTDDVIQTKVCSDGQWINFQDFFVKQGCQGKISGIKIDGIEQATATSEALTAIFEADMIIIAPSNPIVSIGPIIDIPGIKQALNNSQVPVVAVSPLFGGATVKGPAAEMLKAMGYENSNAGIAQIYQRIINTLVVDESDQSDCLKLNTQALRVTAQPTMMTNRDEKIALAESLVKDLVGIV
jgi:LPPG:FO 2-phospho-L-lactate transferase